MNKGKQKRGATRGTTEKYSKVVKELRQVLSSPNKLNTPIFSKKHNVSTNLVLALQELGYIKREKDGFVWNKTSKDSDMDIAEKARIMMNEWTNKRKPTRQRPTGKRTNKGRKVKGGYKKSSFKKKKKTDTPSPVTKRERSPRKEKTNGNVKVQLAKKFAEMGEYEYALELLS